MTTNLRLYVIYSSTKGGFYTDRGDFSSDICDSAEFHFVDEACLKRADLKNEFPKHEFAILEWLDTSSH